MEGQEADLSTLVCLNHFVHYTTVTTRIHEAPEEHSPAFQQRRPYERRIDEINEAFMLHTKTTDSAATSDWKERCKAKDTNKKCPVGIAWPLVAGRGDEADKSSATTEDGLAYNCFKHARIQDELADKLEKRMKPLMSQLVAEKGVTISGASAGSD